MISSKKKYGISPYERNVWRHNCIVSVFPFVQKNTFKSVKLNSWWQQCDFKSGLNTVECQYHSLWASSMWLFDHWRFLQYEGHICLFCTQDRREIYKGNYMKQLSHISAPGEVCDTRDFEQDVTCYAAMSWCKPKFQNSSRDAQQFLFLLQSASFGTKMNSCATTNNH